MQGLWVEATQIRTCQGKRYEDRGALAIAGDYNLYHRYGFEKSKNVGIKYTYDESADYFLVAELMSNFLRGYSGTYKDPDGYMVSDEDVEAFDATFESKEKIK